MHRANFRCIGREGLDSRPPPMTGPTSTRSLQQLTAEHGAFTAYNMRVNGAWTMGHDGHGAAELNLRRVMQVVTDAVGGSLAGVRVLDLASLEGMFALELASRGAEVVAVEAREAHLAKARWAAGELGLANVDFIQADVRSLADLGLGTFDVVLCMGIVYHLRAAEAVELLRQVGLHAERLAVIEGQVSLRPRARAGTGGREYHGSPVPEPPAPWSAVENTESFWLTRPSLLNALGDAGFTSILETATPFVEELAAYRDHVQLVAFKGERVQLAVAPQVAAAPDRVPERTVRRAHPDQGRRSRWMERVAELRGRGLSAVFTKR